MVFDEETYGMLAESYAFIGNSLLQPMSQTGAAGLDPEFWGFFAQFDDAHVSTAAEDLAKYAVAAVEEHGLDQATQKISVEFTKLFVGPPKPAAAPWESYYGATAAQSGFGQATSEMRALLRDAGLEMSNENNQLEDHMGIELLLASELCSRAASEQDAQNACGYLAQHPLKWAPAFAERVAESAPNGYFARLLALACALMRFQLE